MLKSLVTLCVALLFATSASAALNGEKLKTYLIEFSNPSSSGQLGAFGAGYVLGAHDAAAGIITCTHDVKVKQLASVVLSYLLSNPEQLEKQADVLVLKALAAKWPCDKEKSDAQPKARQKPLPKSDSPF